MASLSAFSAPENEKVVEISKGIKVISKVSDFESSAHKITSCRQRNDYPKGSWSEWACVIDGSPTFGIVSAEPTNKIDTIKLVVGKNEFNLDISGMYYGPGSFSLVKDGFHTTLRGCFGDGVATYTAEWIIIKGHSVRTFIRGYEDSLRERNWCENAK